MRNEKEKQKGPRSIFATKGARGLAVRYPASRKSEAPEIRAQVCSQACFCTKTSHMWNTSFGADSVPDRVDRRIQGSGRTVSIRRPKLGTNEVLGKQCSVWLSGRQASGSNVSRNNFGGVMLLTVHTESGSIYEIDYSYKRLRRITGVGNPTDRVGVGWKHFLELSRPRVGGRMMIVWAVVDGVLKTTISSEVTKIDKRELVS